jgi:uncharacterized protein
LLLLFLGSLALAAEPPLPPPPGVYFSDATGIVSAPEAAALNRRLEAFERETSNQLVVSVQLKVPEGAELNDYVFRTFQAWGIGQKQRNNGVLLMVFTQDRKLRIEVGYGLEGVLPDNLAARIIREEITPAFKAGSYGTGLQRGVSAIISATKGEYQGTGKTVADAEKTGSWMFWIFVVLAIVVIIWSHTGDTVYQRAGREIFWTVLQSGGSSRSGGGGSSWGGGGGGFSGGGGSSGGGGASGSW